MPNYQATHYNPGDMPDHFHMGDPIGAPSPLKAANEYLMIMGLYSDVDDDLITEVYVYDVDADERHVYGYRVNGAADLEPMSELPPVGRCSETVDMFDV